jgi:prefoldin alpha subunit
MAESQKAAQGESDEAIRRMAYQLQFYEQQAKQLQRNVEMLQEALEEALSTQAAVQALSKADGAAVFPLGSRVFVPARPEKKDRLLVEAGAGVMVEKTCAQAAADLGESVRKIRDGLAKAQEQLAEISRKASELNAQAEALAQKRQAR